MENLLLSKRPASEPEKDLWVAVIYQALKDASKLHTLEGRWKARRKSGKPMMSHLERDVNDARKAMVWLTTPSSDLSLVCEFAGIEVSCLLAKREMIKSGEFEAFDALIATSE